MTCHSTSLSRLFSLPFFIISTVLTTMLLSACGSQRHTTGNTVEQRQPGSSELSPSELNEAFERLTSDYGEWDTIKIPFSARVDGVKVSLSGNAFMIRDESIYLSAKFFGSEVAVLCINNDSITLVDKFHRIYVSEPTELLTAIFPLTVGNIQDLLLGHCFIPSEDAASGDKKMRKKMDLVSAEGGWTAFPSKLKGELSDLTCLFFVNDDDILESFDAEIYGRTMTAYYGEPGEATDAASCKFASQVEVSVPSGDKSYGGSIKWNLRKADASPTPQLRIPSDCRRVDIKQLLAKLKSM